MSWFIPDQDDQQDGSTPKPGFYLASIVNATTKTSQKGDQYGNILLADSESNAVLGYDVVMLEGRGAGIGAAKASCFGLTRKVERNGVEGTEVFDIREWEGATAVVKLVEEEWNGKIRLTPDDDFGRFGYASAEEWETYREAAFGEDDLPPEDDDIPF